MVGEQPRASVQSRVEGINLVLGKRPRLPSLIGSTQQRSFQCLVLQQHRHKVTRRCGGYDRRATTRTATMLVLPSIQMPKPMCSSKPKGMICVARLAMPSLNLPKGTTGKHSTRQQAARQQVAGMQGTHAMGVLLNRRRNTLSIQNDTMVPTRANGSNSGRPVAPTTR